MRLWARNGLDKRARGGHLYPAPALVPLPTPRPALPRRRRAAQPPSVLVGNAMWRSLPVAPCARPLQPRAQRVDDPHGWRRPEPLAPARRHGEGAM